MANTSVDVRTGADGSLVVQPHGIMDADCTMHFRRVLIHAVRKVRPLQLVLDLGDVSDVDAIHVGMLAALCDVADDQHVIVVIANSRPAIAVRLTAAGIPQQRLTARLAAPVAADH